MFALMWVLPYSTFQKLRGPHPNRSWNQDSNGAVCSDARSRIFAAIFAAIRVIAAVWQSGNARAKFPLAPARAN